MENQRTFPCSFGELLKTSRKRQRLTQKHLAQQLGVHMNTVSSWELGTYLPATRGLVMELARCLVLNEPETRHLLEASLTALSPHWHVPLPRNPLFTGREEILEVLHTHLHTEQVVALTQSYALHGLGGIGKTQIALEYAYRHALEYGATFWIGAETIEHIVSGLLRIAEVLQLPGRDDNDQQRVVAAVQHWLTTHNQWLLIWDNLEEVELLQRFLPPIRQGVILITTRCQALGTLARGIDLEPMGREEGMLFVLRRAKVLEPEATNEHLQQLAVSMPGEYAAADELVTVMGALPLALDQAGAYIDETGCNLAGYLQRYEQQHTRLLDRRGGPGNDHPQSVTATFLLAMERVERAQCGAADVLRVCALLHAEAIPEELFVEGATHLGPALEPLAADPSQLDQAFAALRSLSLVRRHPETGTLSLHRLVQVVLRERMSEQERAVWQQRVVQTLNALFPEIISESTVNIWRQCERLLPHALLCLHRAGAAEESLAHASLAYKVAHYLRERGRYAEAEPLYQRALRIREQALCSDHPDVASSLNYLAVLYWNQGRYAEAEPLYQRALHIREQALGSDHPQVASSLDYLAALYYQQGKYEQAEPLYQRALRIGEQALGSDHPQVASSLNYLAILYWSQGKYEQAEPLYQRALRIREQAQGPDHPQVASSLNNLALLYMEQGKYEQAEPLWQRALHIREQAQGPDHPQVASSLNNLALLYMEQGKYAEAEPLYQRALHIREQAQGADHPEVAHPFNNLAALYYQQGRYAEAESLYQRALHTWEQSLGPEHPDVAQALNGLANLSRERGRYAEAEPLYQRALHIREQHLGRHHPEAGQTLHDLAIFRQKQGNLCEAVSLARRALEIRSRSLGDAHPKTIATRTLYARLLQEQGCAEKGEFSECP